MVLRAAARRLGWSLLECRATGWTPQDTEGLTIVFSPHYDDETLGAAAAILTLRQLGAPVKIVYMTDGGRSHATVMPSTELSALRRAEGTRAAAVLGVSAENLVFLEYPETQLAEFRNDAIRSVSKLLTGQPFSRVFVPSLLEPNVWSPDHNLTTDIVYAALGEVGHRCEVVEYLVWFWYHWPWVPVLGTGDARQILKLSWQNAFGLRTLHAVNASLNLAPFRSQKLEALREHRTQTSRLLTDKPWPVLSDVAKGEFLSNFFRAREWYRIRSWKGVADAA